MYRDFGTILLAMAVGVVFLCLPLFIQWLLAPSNKTKDKLEVFECGEDPEGSAWLKFNMRFYIIALIFLIFEPKQQITMVTTEKSAKSRPFLKKEACRKTLKLTNETLEKHPLFSCF